MKKKDSTFWNMLWSLTLITAVAGGLLGYTHRLTQEPIARATKAGREKAIQQVIPKYDNSPIDEQCSYTVRNEYGETTAIVYPAKKEGVLVGAAVECSNSTGYGGEIRIIVGFEADIGKSPIRNKLQVKQDSGDIDAITAATITSRAFLAAIQTAYTAYIESMKGGNHE